ncbi:MAG: non-hydrolyzing UDP-N-acetylglucosamine 2-epimerase [Candidatus Kerfeldbacteria bacterium]
MKKFKLVTLLGIRPDLIRMFKLIKMLDKGQSEHNYEHIFMHTGQHFDYELDGVFYDELGVRLPDFNMGVGKTLKENCKKTNFAYQMALLYERTSDMIEKYKPDAVMYLGDTNSVMSSVVVARYGIPVIHIEAGGRSYDWRMPEEKNRITIDHMSDALYSYVPRYKDILMSEGVPEYRIKVVGNIIHDAIEEFLPMAEKTDVLKKLKLKKNDFALSTIHREENTNDPIILKKKFNDLIRLAKEIPVVLPLMPRVKNNLKENDLLNDVLKSNIIISEPLGYFEFLKLQKDAKVTISDSGTVQEESLILGTPCHITRLSTERPETIRAGATIMANDNLYENTKKAIELNTDWDRWILNPSKKSPSEVIFNNLVKKIKNNYFTKNRLFEFTKQNKLMKQAYNKK